MKRYLLIMLVILSYLTLTSCASNRNPYPRGDFIEESWMQQVEKDPTRWARGADSWFLTGDPNRTEQANRNAPYNFSISTMMVKVDDFTKIRVAGDFQTQIFGSAGENTVYIYGPNDGVRDVSIQVKGDTLWIKQTGPCRSIKQVIVRIGVSRLTSLMQLGGSGSIEGVRLNSPALEIIAQPRAGGNMYIGGCMNVRKIINTGGGTINLFGAETNGLLIQTANRGSVNVAGKINLTSIVHNGANNINIIGANSGSPLRIYARGRGKIGIYGRVNIREVRTSDYTAVYAYPVMSSSIYAYAYGNSRIGLAGNSEHLFVDTGDAAHFWGRYLCVRDAYVRAHDRSHVNISATNKVFASATQSASVYFFGSPDLMSQFVNGRGVVIPIWPTVRACYIARPQPVHHPDYKGELVKEKVYRRVERRESKKYVQQVEKDPPSKQSTGDNPYVWKNKKLVKSKKYL